MTVRQSTTEEMRDARPYQCGRCGHRYGYFAPHHDDSACNLYYARRLEAQLRASNEGWWRQRDGSLQLAGWAWRREDALALTLALAERLARTADTLARALATAGRDVVEALPKAVGRVQGLVVHDAAMVSLVTTKIRKEWWT